MSFTGLVGDTNRRPGHRDHDGNVRWAGVVHQLEVVNECRPEPAADVRQQRSELGEVLVAEDCPGSAPLVGVEQAIPVGGWVQVVRGAHA